MGLSNIRLSSATRRFELILLELILGKEAPVILRYVKILSSANAIHSLIYPGRRAKTREKEPGRE